MAEMLLRLGTSLRLRGSDQLKDELALVDLGFSEKKLGVTIPLVTPGEDAVLERRQRQAWIWCSQNERAMENRTDSYIALMTHPNLTYIKPARPAAPARLVVVK